MSSLCNWLYEVLSWQTRRYPICESLAYGLRFTVYGPLIVTTKDRSTSTPLPALILNRLYIENEKCLTRNLPSSRLNNNNISYRRIKCSAHQILPCFFIEEKYDFIKVQACQCVWYSLTLTVVYTYKWIYIAYHQLSCSLIM